MCLLRSKKNVPKGECNQEYGILMHNMEEDSFLGTCLMQDGRYVTLSWQDLDKAFKKVLEYEYVISPTKEKILQDLYNAAMADVLALEHQIEISQCAYLQAKANATLARQANRAARNSTSKAPVPTTVLPKKRGREVIPQITILGTQDDSGILEMDFKTPIGVDEISSDKNNSHLPFAGGEVVEKAQGPRQQSRQSGRKILSLTKRRSLINVLNKTSFEEPACEEKGCQNHNNCAEDAEPGPNIDEQSHGNETMLPNASDEQKAPVGAKCNGHEESETGANKDALKETQGEEQNATHGEEGTHGEEHNAAEGANSNKVEEAVPGPNIDEQSHRNETVLPIASVEQKAPVGSKCNGQEESETGAIKAALEETHGEEQNATHGEEGTHGEEHNAAEGANSKKVEDAAPGPNIDEQRHSKETVHLMEEPAPGETIRPESRKKRRKKRAYTVPPTALYTTSEEKLKRRVYACPVCQAPADGSHQCGYCFAHVHELCGLPFEGNCDSYGQRMDCGQCGTGNGEQELTQPWVEDNTPQDMIAADDDNNADLQEARMHSFVKTDVLAYPAAGNKVRHKKISRKKNVRKTSVRKKDSDKGNPDKSIEAAPKWVGEETAIMDLESVEAENVERLEAARFIASLNPGATSVVSTCKEVLRKKVMLKKAMRRKRSKELMNKKRIRQMSHREEEVAPHIKKLKGMGEAPQTITAETVGMERANNEGYDEPQRGEWYWDYDYDTWVHTGTKRSVRRKNLSNRLEKNWVLGMRRNWNTDKKAKMIAKMTIKRDKLATVFELYYANPHNCILIKPVYISYACQHRRIGCCTKTASA